MKRTLRRNLASASRKPQNHAERELWHTCCFGLVFTFFDAKRPSAKLRQDKKERVLQSHNSPPSSNKKHF